jgi:hypothetical protein
MRRRSYLNERATVGCSHSNIVKGLGWIYIPICAFAVHVCDSDGSRADARLIIPYGPRPSDAVDLGKHVDLPTCL